MHNVFYHFKIATPFLLLLLRRSPNKHHRRTRSESLSERDQVLWASLWYHGFHIAPIDVLHGYYAHLQQKAATAMATLREWIAKQLSWHCQLGADDGVFNR